MSVDYLSQNFFNTCGTGYNYGCGSSYSVGNIFGGLGTSIWNMCGTYGAGTCRTKAGIRAQKRAFKQMWGQVGMALGERVVNWVLNLGAGFIQSAITNPSSETDKKGSLKSQKEELDKQINEKLGALGLKEEKECKTKTAKETETYKMFQAELNELTKTISDYDTKITTKQKELDNLGEEQEPVPAATTNPDNSKEIQAIQERNDKRKTLAAEIADLKKKKADAETKQKEVLAKRDEAEKDFNTKIGEIKELIQQRNEIDAKIQAEKANKKNARKKKSSESENTQPAATKENTNNYKDVKKLEELLNAYNNASPENKPDARNNFITAYQQTSSKSSAKAQYKDAYDYLLKKDRPSHGLN